ncbi:hypothetical protein [Lachnotalea glycerini]|uniref:hypothetical protein n=1 Tax=Lachnotalea glycerini TaxID=1763509 RepID=UPI001FA8B2E4|nr:hypothetical protein [Lachnotalea glycerini]
MCVCPAKLDHACRCKSGHGNRLLYQALTKENLNRAYKKVANKGASGIDEVTVEEWETISEKIRKQS